MKKKISVFALLLSLLLAVLDTFVPPSRAKADEMGVYDGSVGEILSTIPDGVLALMDEYHYVVGGVGTSIGVLIYNSGSVPVAVQSRNDMGYEHLQGVTSRDVYASGISYCYDNGQWRSAGSGGVSFFGGSGFNSILYASSLNEYYDRDWNLITDDVPTYSEFMGLNGYRFSQWCADAGLNCKASSNESASVIPYSYNDYWHIVRKTSGGKWLLTTIGSTIGQAKMSLRLSEDLGMQIYEYSGYDSFVISVREYEYDTDGWKLNTYFTYDYDDFSSGLLTLPAGSGIDDTRVLAYTSTDIYSSDGLSVYATASTEYSEPSVPDVTPVPTPGSGSSGSGDSDDTGSDDIGSSGGGRPGSGTRPSLGGEASGGGGLDFIINLFTLIWTKICAVPMSVDGYSISLQQLFVYGALVSIVGGFIMKFIFRR